MTALTQITLPQERRSLETRLKLAEQALAVHHARLATAANKDEVRRAIKTTRSVIHDIKRGLK